MKTYSSNEFKEKSNAGTLPANALFAVVQLQPTTRIKYFELYSHSQNSIDVYEKRVISEGNTLHKIIKTNSEGKAIGKIL